MPHDITCPVSIPFIEWKRVSIMKMRGAIGTNHKKVGKGFSMKVKVFGTLRSVIGEKELEVSLDQKDTVGAVLDHLTVTYPALKEKLGKGEMPATGVNVLVNGRSIQFLDDLDTALEEDDRLALFPPLGGG